MAKHKPTVHHGNTTVTPDEVDPVHQHAHFFSGIPRENRSDRSQLIERALLQGAKSGLLDDRLAIDREDEGFF